MACLFFIHYPTISIESVGPLLSINKPTWTPTKMFAILAIFDIDIIIYLSKLIGTQARFPSCNFELMSEDVRVDMKICIATLL